MFILHLYCRALLNKAALRACGYTKDTPNPPGGEIQRDAQGNPTGLLIARPNATILYSTLAKGPTLPPEWHSRPMVWSATALLVGGSVAAALRWSAPRKG